MQFANSPENQALAYSITYMLAFIVSGSILFISGSRKKYPKTSWLLIIATIVFFTIFGNKMFTSLPAEWNDFFLNLDLPQTGRKSVLGGIAGLILGIIIVRYFLRVKISLADHFAYLVPLCIGIARMGCLMNGCCHGTPTNLPWGVKYGAESHAYLLHRAKGMIPADAELSLAVHPAQLYDILICIAVIVIIWITRNYWRAKGSRLVFAVLCYAILRFFEEFFRDSSLLPVVGEMFWGLKIVQWILLLGIIVIGLYLILSESYRPSKGDQVYQIKLNPVRESIVLLSIWLIVIYNFEWYNYFEFLTLLFFLIPATISFILRTYKAYAIKELQKVIPLLLIFSVILMGQSYIPQKDSEQITYLEVAVDGLMSYYSKNVSQYIDDHQDCEGDWHPILGNNQDREYTTLMGSIDISKTTISSKYTWRRIGGGGFYGGDNVYSDLTKKNTRESTFGVHIRGEFHWQYFGFGLGFRIGRQRIAIADRDSDALSKGEFKNEMGEYKILPIQFIRVGVQDKLYLELNSSFDLPAGKPLPFVAGGLASGLGRTDGTLVGLGYSDAGYYMKGAYVVGKKHVINTYVANSFAGGLDKTWVYSLGYRYRFNFTTKPKPQ